MKKILFLTFLFCNTVCFAQSFQLIKPDVKELKTALIDTNYAINPAFLYLNLNYIVESNKMEIELYDAPDYGICSFVQHFEFEIMYFEEQCSEGAGLNSKLTLPKIDKKDVVEWIKLIFESSNSEAECTWNSDKTKFGPIDNGAGCYYTILELENNVEIEMYCGC